MRGLFSSNMPGKGMGDVNLANDQYSLGLGCFLTRL